MMIILLLGLLYLISYFQRASLVLTTDKVVLISEIVFVNLMDICIWGLNWILILKININ